MTYISHVPTMFLKVTKIMGSCVLFFVQIS